MLLCSVLNGSFQGSGFFNWIIQSWNQLRLAATQTRGIGMIVFDLCVHTGLSFLVQEHTALCSSGKRRIRRSDKLCTTAPPVPEMETGNLLSAPTLITWQLSGSVNGMSRPSKRPALCIKLSLSPLLILSWSLQQELLNVLIISAAVCMWVHFFFRTPTVVSVPQSLAPR